jgi:hypothetical protein
MAKWATKSGARRTPAPKSTKWAAGKGIWWTQAPKMAKTKRR